MRERSPRRAEKEWKRPARVCERGDAADTPPTHHPKFASPMAKKERASPEMSYFREKSQRLERKIKYTRARSRIYICIRERGGKNFLRLHSNFNQLQDKE